MQQNKFDLPTLSGFLSPQKKIYDPDILHRVYAAICQWYRLAQEAVRVWKRHLAAAIRLQLVYKLCRKHAVDVPGWKNFGLVDSLHKKILSFLKVKISQVPPPSPLPLRWHMKFQTVSYGKTYSISKHFENTKKSVEQCHYTSSAHSSARSRWKWSAVRPGHFTRWERPSIEYGTETGPGRSPHFGGQKYLLPVAIEKRFLSCPNPTQVREINTNARTIAVNLLHQTLLWSFCDRSCERRDVRHTDVRDILDSKYNLKTSLGRF